MRLTYYILIILCILSTNAVVATTLFEGEKLENEFFTLEGEQMQFDYYPSAERISWNAFGTWTQIDKGECKVIQKFDICFEAVGDTVEDEEKGTRYLIELTISDLAPKLNVELEADDERVDIDQEIEITATITNEGNSAATGVTFTMNFPSTVEVLSSTAVKNANTVTWQGNLDPGEEKEIITTLELEEFSDFSVQAEVTSTINAKASKVQSNVLDISVNLPYELDMDYSDTTLKKNDFFDLELSLDNTGDDVIEFNDLVLSYPSAVKLISKPSGWIEVDNELRLDKTFEPGDDASYSFTFQALADGEYKMNISAHAELPDFDINSVFSQDITVLSKDVVATIEVPDMVKELEDYVVKATLENLLDEDVLVTYELSSDAFINIYKKTLSIDAGESVVILDQHFKAPEVDASKDYVVVLEVTSGTQTQTITKTFTVTPRKELLEFREEVDVDGDEAYVVVYAKNLDMKELEQVELIDEAPSPVKITGTRFAELTLPVGETKVYEYFVRSEDGEDVTITHIANVDTDDGLYVLEKQFTLSFNASSSVEDSNGAVEEDEIGATTTRDDEVADKELDSTRSEGATGEDTKGVSDVISKPDQTSREEDDVPRGFFSSFLERVTHFFSTIFG
ncbi:DUF11 domain-containing protein [Candidatus Woesearchaeota archaeon]|nr:MAG: DUF11 domain-containing protein [Candidatus Woesearchaeota archaeon]